MCGRCTCCRVIAYLQDARQTNAANCTGTCHGSQSHTRRAGSDSFDAFYPAHSSRAYPKDSELNCSQPGPANDHPITAPLLRYSVWNAENIVAAENYEL